MVQTRSGGKVLLAVGPGSRWAPIPLPAYAGSGGTSDEQVMYRYTGRTPQGALGVRIVSRIATDF